MENIDAIIYINLNDRKDRFQQINQEFEKMGFDKNKIHRYPGIRLEILGCTLSHLDVIKMAKKNNFKNIMIFEDDYEFLIDKEKFNYLINRLFKEDPDFDVVMLSYNQLISESHSEILNKTISSLTASGYIVNYKIYDSLIKMYEEAIHYLIRFAINPAQFFNDSYWFKLQKIYKWYQFKSKIGRQRESYSDMTRKIVKYDI
jgi:glycosyl transferase family 25